MILRDLRRRVLTLRSSLLAQASAAFLAVACMWIAVHITAGFDARLTWLICGLAIGIIGVAIPSGAHGCQTPAPVE